MLLKTDIDRRELEFALPRFLGIAGVQHWQQRVSDLRRWRINNPLYDDYLQERHSFELAFARLAAYRRSTGRIIWPPPDVALIRFYNMALITVPVYDRLSEAGRRRLAGSLRGALRSEFGLGPKAFEFQIATHLMGKGFDVGLHDLENGGGFDFLATKDGLEVEVECKHISADIGRKIHKKRLLDLGIAFLPKVDALARSLEGGRLLIVRLPDRLTGNIAQSQDIVSTMLSALQRDQSAPGACCRVNTLNVPFDPQNPAFSKERKATTDELKALFQPVAQLENRNVIFQVWPGRSVVGVLIESEKPDNVLRDIIETLAGDAKRQLTKRRPAILCAHLSDLDGDQLVDLASMPSESNPLNYSLSDLVARRPHVHTVALMAKGRIIEEFAPDNGRRVALGLRDASFTLRNGLHGLAGNRTLATLFADRS